MVKFLCLHVIYTQYLSLFYILRKNLLHIYGYIYREKYPDFVKYAINEVLNAKCCCCQDTLLMENILMTVPCCHFLCGQCNFIKIWSDNADVDKKCPMCQGYLIDQIFAKSIQYNDLFDTKYLFYMDTNIYIYR